jgi:hypothetical protein
MGRRFLFYREGGIRFVYDQEATACIGLAQ